MSHAAPACRLAGGQELATGALGERLGSDTAERVVGGSKLPTRLYAPVLAPEPFAVHKLSAGQMGSEAAAG